jgi:hypothetical protein
MGQVATVWSALLKAATRYPEGVRRVLRSPVTPIATAASQRLLTVATDATADVTTAATAAVAGF